MYPTYTRTQKVLHWLLAVLLLFWLFVSGEFVEDAEGAAKATVIVLHSTGALVIVAMMGYRFQLRRKHPVDPEGGLKPWERTWGARMHLLLYLLAVIMVASGLLQGLFYDQPVRLLGVLNIAQLSNDTLGGFFHSLHGASATGFKILIAIHILAAVKHQFVDRHRFIQRMF